MVCSKMVAIRPHTHVGDFSYMAQPKLYGSPHGGVCTTVMMYTITTYNICYMYPHLL